MRLIITLILLLIIPLTTFAAPSPAESAQTKQSLEINEKGAKALAARDLSRAEELFARALALDSGNTTAAYNLAGAYLANKKTEQALTVLKEYTQRVPNDATLWARLGDVHFSAKNITEAQKNYEKALQLDEKVPDVASRLAAVYTLQRRFNDAEAMLLRAAKQDPKNPAHVTNLSGLFLASGKPQEAIHAAKRALQMKPSSELYITMGNAYEALKDSKNALISFKRAADLGNKSPELKAKISELEESAQG